ncbi:MAG TPA: hypothetical protein PLX02_05555 [Syntrophorhabdaceae bacterium]|nr:hypothetical protein [Syntrophorhabdaceae bacterium]HQM81071.1 hypothetical protein [Syntrophorhabdaceae bacterium]
MMRIPNGHGQRFMAQKLRDLVEVHAGLDQPCRKGVPQVVEPYILDPGLFPGQYKWPPEIAGIELGVVL